MADTMKDRKLQSMMAALASSAEALFKLTFKEWCEPRPPQRDLAGKPWSEPAPESCQFQHLFWGRKTCPWSVHTGT